MTDFAKDIYYRVIAECGLEQDSKNWRDYEKAKRFIYENYPNLEYFRYHKAVKLVADYLGV